MVATIPPSIPHTTEPPRTIRNRTPIRVSTAFSRSNRQAMEAMALAEMMADLATHLIRPLHVYTEQVVVINVAIRVSALQPPHPMWW